MKLDKKYTILWVVWLLAFGVIEYAALKDKEEGRSLSSHIWELIGTNTPGRNWKHWTFRVGLGGFFAWLIVHFYTGSV